MKGLACVTVGHDFQPVRHFGPSHVTVFIPTGKRSMIIVMSEKAH